MITPDQDLPLTLAELDVPQAQPVPDPESLPDIPDDHPGWGNPRGDLWGRIGVAHACLTVLWSAVSAADVEENGPATRAHLARVYEADYGMSLPTAFVRASAYRGPRTEMLHTRAVALTAAADRGSAALAGNDDQAVLAALVELRQVIDGVTGHALDEEV